MVCCDATYYRGALTDGNIQGTFVNHSSPQGTGLYLYKYADSIESRPRKLDIIGAPEDYESDFHPLGIEYHAPSSTIAVVNHASTGSVVDLFELDLHGSSMRLQSSISGPDISTPNSIAALSENELFITNDHFFRTRYNPILAKLETYLAIPGGNVMYTKLHGDWSPPKTHVLASVPFANGVTLLNSSTLAVSSSSTAAVRLYNIIYCSNGIEPPGLEWVATIALPFIPDNLSVDGHGKLLIAGHPHAPTLEQVAKTNRFCESSEADELARCQRLRLSWLAEWSADEGLHTLYAGQEFGTSTTAVRDITRGLGFAVGLYERGILTWKS